MKARKVLYYLLWPLDLLLSSFGRQDREAKRESGEKGKGRRRRVSSLAWTAELVFVLAVPPLFLFYLMGWRPFTGEKEDES